MIWVNFLHLYQPANIEGFQIEEAYEKSYSRLLRVMENNPEIRMTFNISGCLLERLEELGKIDFINSIKKLNQEGRLDLTSSAAYHGLLPLLPKEEVRKQIQENEAILKKYFGSDFKAEGFFLPEMSYSAEVAKIVAEFGYQWIILDEISSVRKDLDFNKVYLDKASGLKVVFRNRKHSRAYPPDEAVKLKKDGVNVFISATDGELYGLRHQDPTGEMEKIAEDDSIVNKSVTEYILESSQNDLVEIEIRNSSWESEEPDIEKGKPFALWQDKDNEIHRDLWEMTNFVMSLQDKYGKDINSKWCRWHLVRGLASCTYWWASANDFSISFGPYAWNPDIVERGLNDLLRAARAISDKDSLKDKLIAEKMYLNIREKLWKEHWTKHWL